MQFNAAQIATLLNGKLEGNPEALVEDIAKIEEAEKGSICFIANPKYEEFLYSTHASVVLVNEDLKIDKPVETTIIRVKDAYRSFAKLLEEYNQIVNKERLNRKGIEKQAHIAETAEIGEDVYVGDFAYVGEHVTIGHNTKIYPGVYLGDHVKVGDNTTLFAGVKIYYNCEIGNQVIIHSGTVIGSDGFGFAHDEEGNYKKIPQMGNVRIEDRVEIGANTAIDRATMGSTVIAEGVKLDNLIQIAHNVEIGANTAVAAQAGISGSTKVGKSCIFGGQAGLVGHLKIADGTRINAQSGVTKSITKNNTAITGTPAFDYTSALRSQVSFRNLPALEKKVRTLERMIEQLQQEKE